MAHSQQIGECQLREPTLAEVASDDAVPEVRVGPDHVGDKTDCPGYALRCWHQIRAEWVISTDRLAEPRQGIGWQGCVESHPSRQWVPGQEILQ